MIDLLNKAREQYLLHLPFVMYSKPGEPLVTGMFQADSKVHHLGDYSEAGFVFVPFDREVPGMVLIPHRTFTANFKLQPESKPPEKYDPIEMGDGMARKDYVQLVQKAIHAIKEGNLRKIVLSRSLQRSVSDSTFQLFNRLLAKYPRAFCYLWYHPVTGTWLGATPELLLHSDQQMLTTMSLAGTRTRKDGPVPVWGQKEREEQEMVTEYIVARLSPYLGQLEVSEPESVEAGSLWHLRTHIRGVIKDHGLQHIINSLHPTPAICGLPVDEARAFILNSENYNREFYTGFLGELNWGTGEQTSLFVNLRCMKLHKDRATIFVGGGITKSSEPELEWDETVAKSAIMLKVLGYSVV